MARTQTKPFIAADSDGCTILSKPYSWITFGRPLRQVQCCIDHDEAYWYGGSYAQRKAADVKLRECVKSVGERGFDRVVYTAVAWIMYYAVRVGGSPKLPTPWRWRSNVPFRPKDILSGYKFEGVDVIEEKQKDVELLINLTRKRLGEINTLEEAKLKNIQNLE